MEKTHPQLLVLSVHENPSLSEQDYDTNWALQQKVVFVLNLIGRPLSTSEIMLKLKSLDAQTTFRDGIPEANHLPAGKIRAYSKN